VPDLSRQTERTAAIRLQNEGLDVALVSAIESSDYAADAVIAQDPPPSTRAPRVSLLVNRSTERLSYVMPDLIGTDGALAAQVLRERALRVTLTPVQDHSGVPAGTIVRQQPSGGFRVSTADRVTLEVAR
jgi:beta-lactam-binding protein with PASTA domain